MRVRLRRTDTTVHSHHRRRTRATVIAVSALALVAGMVPVAAKAGVFRGPGRPPVKAAPGAGPVARPVAFTSLPNHGLKKGQRTPVEPPSIKATAGRHAAPKRPTAGKDGTTGPQATNLQLLPGVVVGDMSLEAFFDTPDSGWSGGEIDLYLASDQSTVVHSATFTIADLAPCMTLARYCYALDNAHGWGLSAGQSYVVTVSLTATDGTSRVSDFSAAATPRTLPVPPPAPPAQMRGTPTGGSSGRSDATPTLRGYGVNVATGAFTREAVDASTASAYAVNIAARRVYSSDDTTPGLLGVGWNFSYDARVSAGTDSAVFRAEDGTESTFTRKADGSYQAPAGIRSSLAASGSGWQVTTPDQQKLTFDAAGRLQSIVDSRGKGVTLSYDGSGNLTAVTDAGGRRLAVTVSGGHITTLTLPDGRPVTYTYANDRLATVRDADGAVTTYGYDGAGRLSTITDSLGHKQLTTGYDATSGRVDAQTDHNGKVTRFEWDATKQESKVTDPDGVVTFDGFRGNVLDHTQDGNNNVTLYRYDSQLNAQVLVDPMGHQFDMEHDAQGNITTRSVFGAAESGIAGVSQSSTYNGANDLLTETDGRNKPQTFTYNSFHQVLTATDGEHHVTTYAYDDGTGLLTSVTDPSGHATRYAYNADGTRRSQTDPLGNTTSYTYDTVGRLVATTDARGFTTTKAYDREDKVTKVTDPLGHFRVWDYDPVGRLVKYTDANTSSTQYVYNDQNQLTKIIDPDLRTNAYAYTDAGRLKSETDGVGDTTTYGYDASGRLATVTTPRGNVAGANPADFTTTFGYDFNGNRTSSSHPYPGGGTATVSVKYNSLNLPASMTDPLGRTTTVTYDEAGNRSSVTDATGGTWSFTYDGNNQQLTAKDQLGNVTTTHYDVNGRVDARTTAAGEKTTYAYDADGQLVATTSARGNTTKYAYDAVGHQVSTTDPLGAVSTMAYDANGNVSTRTDADRHTTTYTYDNENLLTRIKAPDATNTTQVTVNAYDHAGHLIQRIDPLGFHDDYAYDGAGRISRVTDQLGRTTRQYVYDADGDPVQLLTGRATSSSDPATRAANTVTAHYDILGRLTDRTLGNGPTYSYGYDAANQITSLADPTGVESRGYDKAGRILSDNHPGANIAYTRDAAGNLLTRTLPDGSVDTYTYDADNRTATLTAPAGRTTYGYDPDSELTTVGLPGGSAQTRTYDNAGRVNALTDTAPGGATVAGYTLTRDGAGNPTRLDTNQGGAAWSDAFSYDPANRLTALCDHTTSCSNASSKLSFTYDLVGNRLTAKKTGSGSFSANYQYDAAGELTSVSGGPGGARTFAYDPDGNQIQAGAVKSSYDLDNQVLSVDDGKSTTTYTQGASGDRIASDNRKDSGGASTHTRYDWDPAGALPMLADEQTGAATRAYTYNPDGSPNALRTSGVDELYQPDPFGNTAALTGLDGAVQRQFVMVDPFGGFTATAPGGSGTPVAGLGFNGQYQDPNTGDTHLRVRDYTTTLGRMLSPEPLAQNAKAPMESAYVYGHDNPLTQTDPSGADPCPGGGGGCGYWDSPDAPCWPNCHAPANATDPTTGDEPTDLGDKDPASDDVPWYKIWRPRHDTAVMMVADWLRLNRPGATIQTEVGVPNGSVNGNQGWADVVAWGTDKVEVWEVKHGGGAAEAAGDAQLAAYIKALQQKLIDTGDPRKVVTGGPIPELGPEPNIGNPKEWITAQSGKSPGIVTYQVHKEEPPRLPKPVPVPVPDPVRGRVPDWVKTRPLWKPPNLGPQPMPHPGQPTTDPGPGWQWPDVTVPKPSPATTFSWGAVLVIGAIILLAPVGA